MLVEKLVLLNEKLPELHFLQSAGQQPMPEQRHLLFQRPIRLEHPPNPVRPIPLQIRPAVLERLLSRVLSLADFDRLQIEFRQVSRLKNLCRPLRRLARNQVFNRPVPPHRMQRIDLLGHPPKRRPPQQMRRILARPLGISCYRRPRQACHHRHQRDTSKSQSRPFHST
jgi:hypothetical protein